MGKLRVEFCVLGPGRGREARDAEPLGATTLDVSATPTAAGSRPAAPASSGTVFADLTALDVAMYVDVGATADPAAEPRLLLLPGRPQRVRVGAGDAVSAVLATDVGAAALPSQDQPLATVLTDRSGTVAAGGTAQQACAANASRRFLLVSNPSDASIFWFNVSGPAGNGAGSLPVGPGAAFVFDKVVPSGAVSVFGPAAGQPFTVKEA